MDSDEALVVLLLLIYLTTLSFLVFVSGRVSTRTLLINLVILAVYSAYFGMHYYYWGSPGSALVWWFYYLVFIAFHWICNGVLLIVRLLRKREQKDNGIID
jgi:heme/copper-type cytochrome/quinol oxidase subunit 4